MTAQMSFYNATPDNWHTMTEDQLLMLWSTKKSALETVKAEEMELRKYIVKKMFPQLKEGTHTKELGHGYQLKASIKYNYNLGNNELVETSLAKISQLGNDGSFIVDRLVSWKPSLLLTEYRQLMEDNDGSNVSSQILNIVNGMLTITEGAPTLEIKEPKGK